MTQPESAAGPGASAPTRPRPPTISTRAIVSLAWPVIVTNLLMSAVIWVDLYMVGRLGKDAVAAVGLGNFILGLFMIVLMAVTQGTATVVAQAHGANDRDGVDAAFQQSALLGAAVALVITLIACWPNSRLLYGIFIWCDALPPVAELGAQYMRIVLYANAGQLVAMVGQAALRSTGDTRTPLWLTGSTNIVNIILNYILIFGHLGFPAMGVAGAAWGTAIARALEAVSYLTLLGTGQFRVRFRLGAWGLAWSTIRKVFAVGLPAAGEQLLMSFGFLLYNKLVAHYGTAELAAYQIGVVMLQISFMPGLGFSVAATTFVGQWIGAGDYEEARRAGDSCVRLAGVLMALLGVGFIFLAGPVARWFINDASVVPLATTFIRLLAICQPTMAIHFVMSGALRGAADARSPLRGVIVSMYLVRLPMALLVAYVLKWNVYWVWMAMVFAHLARAEFLHWTWRREHWRRIRL